MGSLNKVNADGNVLNDKKNKQRPRSTDQNKKSSRRKDEHDANCACIRANDKSVLDSPSHGDQLSGIPLQQRQVFFPSLKESRNLFFSDNVLFGGCEKRQQILAF